MRKRFNNSLVPESKAFANTVKSVTKNNDTFKIRMNLLKSLKTKISKSFSKSVNLSMFYFYILTSIKTMVEKEHKAMGFDYNSEISLMFKDELDGNNISKKLKREVVISKSNKQNLNDIIEENSSVSEVEKELSDDNSVDSSYLD